jgi:hypothetical protein
MRVARVEHRKGVVVCRHALRRETRNRPRVSSQRANRASRFNLGYGEPIEQKEHEWPSFD